jgi:hypothetical protein
MSTLTLSLILISAAMITVWIVFMRRKQTVWEEEAEEAKERFSVDLQKKDLRIQKHKQLQMELKDPLIQSLWSLLEEAVSLELINKFSNEQFKVSHDDQSIELAMSWIAKSDGVSQLALRRLAHKHATDIAIHYELYLLNMFCDESKLELQFTENTIV